jgi:nitroreductase
MIELLRTRRTIRKYGKKKIDGNSVEIIKEAILRSPCARGNNTWTFVFVDSPDLLMKLSMSKEQGSDFIKDAALTIVVCADEKENDMWIENCCIAAITAQLTAHSLGLGSCWSQIRNRPQTETKPAEVYIQELLGIPKNLKVECMISIGYPDESKNPHSKGELEYSRIKYNSFK